MDLHGIAGPYVAAVNPFILGTVQVSTGSTTQADGSRVPTYNVFTQISMQVQALTYRDLQQLSGLNLNGTRRAIYIRGQIDSTSRTYLRGGDLITIESGPNAGTWLVAQVLEQWPDWSKAAVTLQN